MGGIVCNDDTASSLTKQEDFCNDYVSFYLCCPVCAVVPDRCRGLLEEPVKEVDQMSESLTAPVPASLHADFCYVMDDNSMEGAGIHAGDIVALVAGDHAENGQIVAVQTDTAVLLRRMVCDGQMFATCSTRFAEDVCRLDELPGAKIVGVAVEVWHMLPLPKNDPQGVQV